MQLKFGKPKNLDDASPPDADTRTFTIVNRIRLKSAFKCSPRRKVSNQFFKPHSIGGLVSSKFFGFPNLNCIDINNQF